MKPVFTMISRALWGGSIFLWGLFFCLGGDSVFAQSPVRLDTRSKRIVMAVNESVKAAGQNYQAGNFDQAGAALDKAVKQIEIAGKAESPELHDALVPAMKRIVNARAMLELEGVLMAPFTLPSRPESKPAMEEMPAGKNSPASETKPIFDVNSDPGSTPGNPGGAAGISFVSQVAPILAGKCGNCHTTGSKGGFSLATFQALMKGPPEGVVIFAGDTVGSRLIETIESGDMPRGGGKVTPAELAVLKQWINEGAKFDGKDPAAKLTSLAAGGEEPEPAPKPMEIAKPTGKETVSFASDIAPILVENCSGCHLNAMRVRGGLQMNTLAQMFRGGDSGAAVEPGKGEASLLVRKLRGLEGDRMPAGGKPPLSEQQIKMISTWVDEGATLPKTEQEMPLGVLAKKAWLASASIPEVTQRRAEITQQQFRLAGGSGSGLNHFDSEHFSVWGEAQPKLLEAVAVQAESVLQQAAMVLPSSDLASQPEGFFGGLASIYVLPRRYDYSEFAKMVEGRSVPTDWQSHWKYNGIEAYVAVVASDRDEDAVIAERLAAPVVSLAVASRSITVPRWFANGLGQVASSKKKIDRSERERIQAELITAVGSLKSGKEFFAGRIAPERADLIGAAVCQSFLTREKRRGFDAVMRQLKGGKPFDGAFLVGMGVTPEAYLDAWLGWVK